MFLLLLTVVSGANAADRFEGRAYYLGDLHAHSGRSGDAAWGDDGTCWGECGQEADFWDIARDNGLDFVAVTDHVNGNESDAHPQMTDAQFDDLWTQALAEHDPQGGFVTIPAAELWLKIGGSDGGDLGHRTVLFLDDDDGMAAATLADLWPSGVVDYATLESCEQYGLWLADLQARFGDVIAMPHHPSASTPMATDWSCWWPEYEPAVEVYSVHGNALDAAVSFDAPDKGIAVEGTVASAMAPGGWNHKLGFVAGTDRHDSRPGEVCLPDQYQAQHSYGGGLTIVVAPGDEAFSRGTVYDALVARQTIATTGPFLPFGVSWSSRGRKLGGLGAAFKLPDGADLDAEVRFPADDAAAVTGVTLVGPNGQQVALSAQDATTWRATVPAAEVPAWLYVEVTVDGDAWWGVGQCDDGGAGAEEHLWTSPSRIRSEQRDEDGDGWTFADGDCDDLDPSVNPGAGETWYDGVDQTCDGNDGDQDGDGHLAEVVGGDDCNDLRARVHPGAPENPLTTADEDCDGSGSE